MNPNTFLLFGKVHRLRSVIERKHQFKIISQNKIQVCAGQETFESNLFERVVNKIGTWQVPTRRKGLPSSYKEL